MGYMNSLYTSMCVVIHNKGTGVDKNTYENVTQWHGPVTTVFQPSTLVTGSCDIPLNDNRVVTITPMTALLQNRFRDPDPLGHTPWVIKK